MSVDFGWLPPSEPDPASGFLFRRCLYPRLYTWFVFLSAMDVMFTWIILWLGGREVNWIADQVIGSLGLPGAVGLKFGSVIVVIMVCEIVGRARGPTGRTLATAAVFVSSVPVGLSFYLLLFGGPQRLREMGL